MGALIGAVGIFILFLIVAPPFRSPEAMATVLYASSTIGIMAVGVGLLMIGGEFDLSSGVAVTTASLAASMLSYNLHLNLWVGALLALCISLAVGFFNGYMVMRTKIPSFLITLSTFLMLTGINLAVTKLVAGQVATPSVSDMQGFDSGKAVFASSVSLGPVSLRITVLWWILFTVIATYVLFKTRVGNWIFAVGGNKDAARAALDLADAPREQIKGINYLVNGFLPTPNAGQIAEAVRQAVPDARITFEVDPKASVSLARNLTIDDATARAEWGWTPSYDLEAMVADVVAEARRS